MTYIYSCQVFTSVLREQQNPNRVRGFAVDETSPSRMIRPRVTRMQDILKLYEEMKRTKNETVWK